MDPTWTTAMKRVSGISLVALLSSYMWIKAKLFQQVSVPTVSPGLQDLHTNKPVNQPEGQQADSNFIVSIKCCVNTLGAERGGELSMSDRRRVRREVGEGGWH